MRFLPFLFALGFLSQRCVLVQVQKKDTVLSRTEEKTETHEDRRFSASLTALGFENGFYKLSFNVRTKITVAERRFFQEQVLTENRLFAEGRSLRFFAGWIAFAFEDEGWGGYFLDILGGIPLTLGLNLPIAVGDWLSMPFRLRDEKSGRRVKEEKKLAQRDEPADCPQFLIRIEQVDYPLDAQCVLRFEAEIFENLLTRHAHKPKFAGSLRYELIAKDGHGVPAPASIFLRRFPERLAQIEFIERR